MGAFFMQKIEKYKSLLKQIISITDSEKNNLANLANTIALIHHEFHFWWTGFYFVEGEELVLGPFQGPVACTRILKGKGVCGSSFASKQTIIVKDVHEFPGHIACSAESNSEIVVPVLDGNKVKAVLDIDSKNFGEFDLIDKEYLEKIAKHIVKFL